MDTDGPNQGVEPAAGRVRRALSGGALYLVAQVLERGLFLLLLPFITRRVEVAVFAQFALLRIGIGIAQLISDAGLGLATVRYVAENRGAERDRVITTLLVSRALTCTLVALAAWPLLMGFGGTFLEQNSLPAVALATLAAFWLTSAADAAASALRAEERHHLVACAWIFRGVSSGAGYLVLVVLGGRGLSGLLWAFLFGEAVGLAIALPFTARSWRQAPSVAVFVRLVRYGVPTALSLVNGVFGALDRYVVQRLTSIELAGVYHLANGPAFALELVRRSAFGALEPYLFGIPASRQPPTLDRLVRGYTFLLVSVALALSLLAPELIAILAPASYRAAVSAVPGLAFAAVSQAVFRAVGLGAGLAKQTRPWAIAGLFELFLALTLLGVLTPIWGIAGAALGRFSAAFIGMLLCYYLTLRVFPTRLPMASVSATIAGALALSLLSSTGIAGGPFPLWTRLCSIPLAVGLAAVVLGLSGRRERAPS